MHLQSDARHGLPEISIFGFVGINVPAICGMQGCGVSTPMAAAVADATCGFAIDVHIPKGPRFTIPCESEIVPQGFPPARTLAWLVTLIGAGVVPNEHMHVPVAVTSSLILRLILSVQGL